MENRHTVSKAETASMNTEEMRANFLVPDLFVDGEITLVHSHFDRVVMGGAVPLDEPLWLLAPDELRADYFLERREMGVFVTQGTGVITTDGDEHELPKGGCLYIGRGVHDISFRSVGDQPARFYFFSAPAHASYPIVSVLPGEGDVRELGDQEHANRRTLNRYIHDDGIQSCQIVMGLTQLHPGSMWNTMPAHTHDRRTECYLYLDLPEDARVVHLFGDPTETRHMIVADHEAIISPSWSIHSGVGTQAYSFIWAMAGENKSFDDMDHQPIDTLR
ncbi:MAG: 5-dehydro-4-deoxy-D-glucuronate isomerase [Propionibacterium sp.]|nr:5-dehydro-4-deoxy-D-glucuronate isomerase [Propionibacterium sp.]